MGKKASSEDDWANKAGSKRYLLKSRIGASTTLVIRYGRANAALRRYVTPSFHPLSDQEHGSMSPASPSWGHSATVQ